MLWLCIYLPQWPLEALTLTDDRAAVTFVNEKNKRRIIACNAAAIRSGVNSKTEFTSALALNPTIVVQERSTKAEIDALKRLAAWAYQWSSQVTWREAQPHLRDYATLLWLEIGASRALYGSYESLLKHLEASLQTLGYEYCLGVAPTLEGAAVLARAKQRVLIICNDRLVQTLRKLAVKDLALSSDIIHALKRSGITKVAALLDLPSDSIARRFGAEVTLYLRRLCGIAPDPRPLYRLPKHYDARYEFGFAIQRVTALLFPLQRMLHEFCGYLRATDTAVQRFIVILEHEQHAVTRIAIGLAAPNRDAGRLLALIKEKLHASTLANDVYALRIKADEFTAPAVRQQSLIVGQTEIVDELQQVLEMLAARLGNATHTVQTLADHRPEQAWRFVAENTIPNVAPNASRPLWLLREPRLLANPPKTDTQPERIASGWWNESIERDYYVTRATTGERCWVFLDRKSGRWYLHGYWA